MNDWGKNIYNTIFEKNKLVRFTVVTLLVYLFFKFIFSLIAPFFLAFILITLFYPLLQHIQKRIPTKKKFIAVGVILLILSFISVIFWILGYNSGGQLENLTDFVEEAYRKIQMLLHRCCYSLDGKFGWNGYEIENFIIERMAVIMENVQVQILPSVISSSYTCFKGIFGVVAFFFITAIAAILMEKDYKPFMEWLKTDEDVSFIWKTLKGVLDYIITFIKAQGTIMLIIIVTCCSVLWAAGVNGSLLWGILAGCLDVLPFIGTGIVLVPIAIWQLLNGYYVAAAVCAVLYAACIFIREFLEPKLIGDKLGIAPVLMMLGIYAGIKLFGIAGIIEGPLAIIVIYQLLKA